MFSKSEPEPNQTASVAGPSRQANATAIATPSEADLAYARAVAADALARGSKDASIPWENPHTGASGNITPLAAVYTEGAATCRDFLASYVLGQAQAWLQGEACRTARGAWEVKSLKPFKQG
jgi:surface antigen